MKEQIDDRLDETTLTLDQLHILSDSRQCFPPLNSKLYTSLNKSNSATTHFVSPDHSPCQISLFNLPFLESRANNGHFLDAWEKVQLARS